MLLSESSSDKFLVDIQIEESLSRETLMSIDSTNKKEDCITFFFIFFLLFITTIVGIYGPPVQLNFDIVYTFLKNEKTVTFSYSGMSSFNHFIKLKISFFKKNPIMRTPNKVPLIINIYTYKNNKLLNTHQFRIDDFSLNFQKSKNWTDPKIVYSDRLIKYDKLKAMITFDDESRNDFLKCRATWILGNPEHPLIQMWLRGIYSLTCLISLIMFLTRLKKTPFKIWHLEQKLTVFLVLLAFFADDPLYFAQKLEVNIIGVIIDLFSTSLFSAYSQFFVLTLFDSLRYKNRKIGRCFFGPKHLFFLLLLITKILYGLIDESQPTIYTKKFSTQTKYTINSIYFLINIVYSALMIVTIARAGKLIDITEKYKFSVYSSILLICISVIITVDLIFKYKKNFQNSSLSFVIHFTIQNLFVLLMVVFHWPYETLTDQQYHDTGEGATESDFFVK